MKAEYRVDSWAAVHDVVNNLPNGTVTVLLNMSIEELKRAGAELPCIRQLRHPPIEITHNAFSKPPSLTITIKD